jgi:hypothetical protein
MRETVARDCGRVTFGFFILRSQTLKSRLFLQFCVFVINFLAITNGYARVIASEFSPFEILPATAPAMARQSAVASNR